MATGVHHESAKIYAFPTKRFQPAGFRQKADIAEDIVPTVYDSCWYHEEAMKDAETPAKPKFTPRVID
jgi:hypothetical protein